MDNSLAGFGQLQHFEFLPTQSAIQVPPVCSWYIFSCDSGESLVFRRISHSYTSNTKVMYLAVNGLNPPPYFYMLCKKEAFGGLSNVSLFPYYRTHQKKKGMSDILQFWYTLVESLGWVDLGSSWRMSLVGLCHEACLQACLRRLETSLQQRP